MKKLLVVLLLLLMYSNVQGASGVNRIVGLVVEGPIPTALGICGTFSMNQGFTLTLSSPELGGVGGFSSKLTAPVTWFAGVNNDVAPHTRSIVRGTDGTPPVRSAGVVQFTGDIVNPAAQTKVAYSSSSNTLWYIANFQAGSAGCVGAPCQTVQVCDVSSLTCGVFNSYNNFAENCCGTWTAFNNQLYTITASNTGGASVILRKINTAGVLQTELQFLEAASTGAGFANDGTFLYRTNPTTTIVNQHSGTSLVQTGSINLGGGNSSGGTLTAYANKALWIDTATALRLCEIPLPAFTGCTSTYIFNNATEGSIFFMWYDYINNKLYVVNNNTAGTAVGFIHRFSVLPLVKEASQGLSYGSTNSPFRVDNTQFSVVDQRMTWLGTAPSNGGATINTISTCGNIIG